MNEVQTTQNDNNTMPPIEAIMPEAEVMVSNNPVEATAIEPITEDIRPNLYTLMSKKEAGFNTMIVEVMPIEGVGAVQRDILITASGDKTVSTLFVPGVRVIIEGELAMYLKLGVKLTGEVSRRRTR
jgi:hypothetical protein